MNERDHELTEHTKRLDQFHKLEKEKRRELAVALLQRKDSRKTGEHGYNLLRKEQPETSDVILRSVAFDIYEEIPEAIIDLLAWLELSLQDKKYGLHHGIVYDVLGHIYDWLLFDALLPCGKQKVIETLSEIKEAIKTGDKKWAMDKITGLVDLFKGMPVSPPPFID